MNLTIRSNHAFRLLTYCALRPREVATVADIARACGASENHLAKIAHALARHGWIETIRGRKGGVRLRAAPAEVSLGEVVRATESLDRIVECFDAESNTCPLAPKCRFKPILAEALDAFHRVLDRYTLADLVQAPHELAPLLGLEPAEA